MDPIKDLLKNQKFREIAVSFANDNATKYGLACSFSIAHLEQLLQNAFMVGKAAGMETVLFRLYPSFQ